MAIELNEKRFLDLLAKLIGEAQHLQNNPPKFVPSEDKAGNHVLEVLRPHSTENGGPLKVKHVVYHEGRGNIIITYPSPKKTDKSVAFVGSHLDVVPANPDTWQRNPFQLIIEGDQLFGRGTTDCLGHVALLTDFFVQLAEKKPELNFNVAAVFIASEESSVIPGVGVEELVKHGELDFLKNGPVYWVDSADSQPCIGTAAAIQWHLTIKGKLFHSGLPHKAINPIELGGEVIRVIQERFYQDFPPHPKEQEYHFATPSTLKPTQIKSAEGSLNQIPPSCTISGDIRLTPFYDIKAVQTAVEGYVKDLNANISSLPTRGPSKYELPQENLKGVIELRWEEGAFPGIACNIDSPGFHALDNATREVVGESKPYSIGGSLPLVKELQDEGFDVQITGFGKSSVYHGDNEYCLLSDMKNATKVFSRIIDQLNSQ